MRYLVNFKDALGQEWEETLETESQVLEHQMKECIISVKKIEEELTLEQLQEKVENKTPKELQEADYYGKHIKIGDIVYLENESWDEKEQVNYYDNYYVRVTKIIKLYGKICPSFDLLAYDGGTLISDEVKQKLGNLTISRLYYVCTPKYFDTEIYRIEQIKDNEVLNLKREINSLEERYDREIERLKVLKGLLQ